MSEPTKNLSPMAGGLFIAAGLMFIVAGAMSDTVSFYGVGAAMMGVSVVFFARAKKDGPK